MTDTVKEQISAFLDGELPEAETTLLLKRLERDDELKGTLSRYSLIGSVLRAEGDVLAAHHVAARVSAAIEREPPLGAAPPRVPGWLKPVAGLAVAVGVAAATVALLPLWLPGAPADAGPAVAATVAAAPVVVDPAPVVTALEAPADDPSQSYTTPPAVTPQGMLPPAHLASYLLAHAEDSAPLGARSLVTVVVDEPAAGEAPEAAAR